MWSQALILPWLLGAGVIQLPPPGLTQWTHDDARTGAAPWTATVTTSEPCYLFFELSGDDGFSDLDLAVHGDGWTVRAASHLSGEVLLLPVLAGEVLRVEVPVSSGVDGGFRLGVTPLQLSGRLEAETELSGESREFARVALYAIERPLRAPVSLVGRGELLVFDRNGELLDSQSCDESATLDPSEGVPECLALVRSDHSGPFTVRADAPDDEVDRRPSLERFLDLLGKTPAQRQVVRTLSRNPDFQRLRAYLEGYPGGIPVRLLVVPGLRAHGVERFGTYSRGTLAINPTIAAHQTNPQELVDTLVHELVHAVLSLPRAARYPLGPDVLDSSHDRRLHGLGGAPLKRGVHPKPVNAYLEAEYGPSASNPDEDYSDINAGAQRLIIKVIRDNLARTGLGKTTIVFKHWAERAKVAETK